MNFQIDGRGLATALLFTVLVVTGCSDSTENTNVLLNQGVKHYENQEFARAQLAFNKALKIDAKNAESYFYLGKIAVAQSDAAAAIIYFNKAITLNDDYFDARLNLGQLYAIVQKLSEAQEQVDALVLLDAGNNDLQALQALILLKQGKKQEAVTLLLKILHSSPKNVFATEVLAKHYLKNGKENEALQVLEQANKANAGKEDSILKPLLALYTNRKLSSEAEQVILQLVKNNQNNPQYYRGLIEFYARQDRLNDAVLVIRDSISKDPNNDAQYKLLIDLYKNRYGLRKAITETRQMINDKPEMSSLRLALARLYTANKQVSMAETVYQGVVDMDGMKPNGLVAKIEIAKFHLQRNELAKAEQLITEVLAKNPKQEDALLLRSGIAMQQKDFNKASLMLDMVIQVNPDNTQARMRIALLLAQQGKLDEALLHIDAVLSKNDSMANVLKLKAQILTRQRKFEQLELVYTKLESVSPKKIDGFLGNGQLYLSKNKYRQALSKFEKAFSLDPESAESLRGLIAAKIGLGETKGAESSLKQIIKKNPQHPVAFELLGNVYFSNNEYELSEKEYLNQLEIGTKSQSIYIRLAQSRLKQDNQKSAFEAFNMGIEKQPRNLNLRIKLAQAYLLVGELSKAEETLEKTIALAPRNAKLKAMLASVRNKQQK